MDQIEILIKIGLLASDHEFYLITDHIWYKDLVVNFLKVATHDLLDTKSTNYYQDKLNTFSLPQKGKDIYNCNNYRSDLIQTSKHKVEEKQKDVDGQRMRCKSSVPCFLHLKIGLCIRMGGIIMHVQVLRRQRTQDFGQQVCLFGA